MVGTDMDGSAVKYKNDPFNSGWDALGDSLPPAQRKKWYETRDYFYPRKELYPQWFLKQVEMLKGQDTAEIAAKIFPPPYAPGFLEFFRNLPIDMITAIISSGVDFIANRIKHDADLDIIICNKLHIFDGKFTGTGEEVVALWSKLDLLKQQADKLGILLENICYVGDSENDIDILKAVGRPYIINPHLSVKGLAPEIKDYREIKLD